MNNNTFYVYKQYYIDNYIAVEQIEHRYVGTTSLKICNTITYRYQIVSAVSSLIGTSIECQFILLFIFELSNRGNTM